MLIMKNNLSSNQDSSEAEMGQKIIKIAKWVG